MTHAANTPSHRHRQRSADSWDVRKLIGLGIWIGFCVLLVLNDYIL